jgi:hypothetical protein
MNRTNVYPHSTGAHEPIDLDLLMFGAKIDFITLSTEGKMPLPRLDGRPVWSAKEHYRKFSIHDATGQDLARVLAACGDLPVDELEIAVDARPRSCVAAADRERLIDRVVVEIFGARLDPKPMAADADNFRALYRPAARKIIGGFNSRLPHPRDQQLHGGRDDPAQVKVYGKRVDMKADLAARDWSARVEVALREELGPLGITAVSDVFDFRFRKALMPFFRHVRGTARRRNARARVQGALRAVLDQWYEKRDRELWDAAGVGAFKPGGKGRAGAVRLIADRALNDRIGQALGRLEKSISAAKSVCF